MYSTSNTAKATFQFTGRRIGLVAPKHTNRGKAEIWIDGTRQATVDLYAAASSPRRIVFVKSYASSGTHTLEVRVLRTKNSLSSDYRVDIDAFVVM